MTKIFPIATETSCQLKWSWSTLYLNTGVTRSCHRTSESVLSPENFENFHNTELKKRDRTSMLNGQWPGHSCGYCRSIEQAGGVSDRIRQLSVPYTVPPELEADPGAVVVSPTLLEVFFNNTCNMGCLYCDPEVSSVIDNENKKFGEFRQGGVHLVQATSQYQTLVPLFWKWYETNFGTLSRLHILGGEPFYQQEFNELLDMMEKTPSPNCELNIITNLKVSMSKLQSIVARFKSLLARKHLKRVDITCSIDCWGPQQEYVRWGMDIAQWEENFKFLCEQKWLTLNINQTISPLTIKTMPELLRRLSIWRETKKIGHWFSGVDPGPNFMKVNVLGGDVFADDFAEIISLMPERDQEDLDAKAYMQGIIKQSASTGPDTEQIRDLLVYLDEKDRRRGTDWTQLFPWLIEFKKVV